MIPTTVLGLLLFVAVLGPGYAWVRYTETRSPRPQRSGVLEAADVVFIGAFATTLALVAVFIVGPLVTEFPRLHEVVQDAQGFLRDRPYDAFASAAAVLVLSVGGTLAVASVIYGKREKPIRPGSTVWHDVFRVGGKHRDISVSVQVTGGRIVEGLFLSHVMDTDAKEKDLALQAPLYMWTEQQEDGHRQRLVLPNDRVIIPGSSIEIVWVRYLWDRPRPVERT